MQRVSRAWSSQNSTPLTGCLKNAWAGSDVTLRAFIPLLKARVLIWVDSLRTLCWCSWCRDVCGHKGGHSQSSQAPVRTTGQYCRQRKGESQSPFLGNISGPMATTNHNFKNKLFGMKGRALLQFIYGFGFSKELAGFWNKPSLSTDLWGHSFCLIADRELILLEEGRKLWLLA